MDEAKQQPAKSSPPRAWILPVGASCCLLLLAAVAAVDYTLASALGQLWPRFLLPHSPAGIVIHHSATPPIHDAKKLLSAIDRSHAARGFGAFFAGRVYHVGYHYIVMPDGRVLQCRPEWMPGAHCRGHNDTIGICLVGNFIRERSGHCCRPTKPQLEATLALVKKLLRRYRLPYTKVYFHRDLGQTLCPGPCFPYEEFRQRLAAR